MSLSDIYIITVLFSLLQLIIETTKTFFREKVLKKKQSYPYEDREKDIEEIKEYSEKTAKVLSVIMTKNYRYRVVMCVLCFIPVINIICAFFEICEILNVDVE